MIAMSTAVRQRILAALGRLSMYRLTLWALVALAAVALIESVLGVLSLTPFEIVATLAVLLVAVLLVDAVAQQLLRVPRRVESSLITAFILLFVIEPGTNPDQLGAAALAGGIAALSKYILVWRGRHVFNPVAVAATVLTLSTLGFSAWWVGTPTLAAAVVLLGLVVLWRTERIRVVALFVVVAVAVAMVRLAVQGVEAGLAPDPWADLTLALLRSPVLFLGAFMLAEPLTLPSRRWQQLLVAGVVGVLVGWPINLGLITLGQERALLIGNLLAFLLARRGGLRLTLERRRTVTATVRELTFRLRRPVPFAPGQYVELQVPHRRPDARGTRREFSIVSAPEELPLVRIAYRETEGERPESSYKRALGAAQNGDVLSATGIWGDFVLPTGPAPLLLVGAGIGVTPFVSQLGHRMRTGEGTGGDIVVVLIASAADELAYLDEIAAGGVSGIVVTPDEPADLPDGWRWAGGARLDAALLTGLVPDLSRRHALVSGPPALIAQLAPALRSCRRLTTDAFAGY
ncbi:ferredoxin-NADP reductase [Microbacterium resistens]|uniref:Ferredoxin-NADP reductase n=1 Tax=Microbacterium resistens TaxID=156977 RepID=A0ABU1S7T7_9MICO|nr:FAD-dependent oxidoreductase [Microbacterium resistens]MDR6865676.1 ferredoxin-NADP reductase [Microbacterium resistens]